MMPGTASVGKTWRVSVAPVAMTLSGSTPGAMDGIFDKRMLLSTDWPAPREVDEPTQKETGGGVGYIN